MEPRGAAGAYLPVPVSTDGPFMPWAVRAHTLVNRGQIAEALTAIDHYTPLARLAGDEVTVGFLLQARVAALIATGHDHEAVEVAQQLLLLRERLGNPVAEAKTRADLAGIQFRLGQVDEGLDGLARAHAALFRYDRADLRYLSALNSLAIAAMMAELYELAAEVCERVLPLVSGFNLACPIQDCYVRVLLEWGLRLEQIGRVEEATARFRRCRAIAAEAIADLATQGPGYSLLLKGPYLVSLAKLGEYDEAIALAEQVVVPLRTTGESVDALLGHLGYGLALRARGDLAGARRELVAADQLSGYGGTWTDRLQVRRELAMLDAGPHAAAGLLDVIAGQAQRLWELRLARVGMVRQIQHRLELETERQQAAAALLRDELTGIGNRRHYEQVMAGLASPTDRPAGALSLLLIDVDEFKPINDTYSHAVGDRVLVEVASVLRANCRDQDVATRYGGDEFALFLRTDLRHAMAVGERIRRIIDGRDWSAVAPGLKVTISTGVAELRAQMTAADLLAAADARLYQAKRSGRNSVAG
ncbi:diguanylate cyclase [Planosporangium thailandense]|uniref:Diguanylate cyclase n=1 Tax=Planosporangium thailandense TaxID=765197 RepID=A0ABX0Y6B7_9ACTN|nr:GGDEF domain-containing protein [Planosporangium thailandense]NJC72983.1 diguanylate cyclase [Planosporangium thailandense]